MKISELSAASGVPLPTVKYYLREGLLQAGDRTARNQADYGDAHLARLRLIRALIEVGRLSVTDVREVLLAADDPKLPLNEVMGAAHRAVTNRQTPTRTEPAWTEAREILLMVADQRGWCFDPESPAIGQAADAIAAVLAMDVPELTPLLDVYADLAETIVEKEVDAVLSMKTPEDVVRGVVIGTVIGESLLNALRLLAQSAETTKRLEPEKLTPTADPGTPPQA